MIPSAISPRPGQFDFSPKPRAGLRGSRVAPGPSEGVGLRLSRPCQMGGAAVSTTPARIQNPAIQISTMRSQFVAQYPYHASRTAVLRPVHGPAPAAAQDGRSRFPAAQPSGQVQMSLYGLLKRPARQAPCPQGRLAGLTVEEELRAPDDGCGQLTPVRQSAPRMNRWLTFGSEISGS